MEQAQGSALGSGPCARTACFGISGRPAPSPVAPVKAPPDASPHLCAMAGGVPPGPRPPRWMRCGRTSRGWTPRRRPTRRGGRGWRGRRAHGAHGHAGRGAAGRALLSARPWDVQDGSAWERPCWRPPGGRFGGWSCCFEVSSPALFFKSEGDFLMRRKKDGQAGNDTI